VPQQHLPQQVRKTLGRHRKTALVVLRSSGRGRQATSEQGRAVTLFRGLCDSVLLSDCFLEEASKNMYLAGPCDTQRRQQSISSMITWCAQDSLDHRDDTRAVKQLFLLRILLENPCKCKPLYGAFPVIACWRLDRDMSWMCPRAIFDSEKARVCRMRRAQAQKNVEECARRSSWRFHGHFAFVSGEYVDRGRFALMSQKCGVVRVRVGQQVPRVVARSNGSARYDATLQHPSTCRRSTNFLRFSVFYFKVLQVEEMMRLLY
jgi:hypothetical protein